MDIAKGSPSQTPQFGIANNPRTIKFNAKLDESIATSIKAIFHEYKDIFAWNYTILKGIPPNIAQHYIEFNTTIPPTHRARYKLNPNYATIVKHELNKLLSVGFITSMEEASLLWY